MSVCNHQVDRDKSIMPFWYLEMDIELRIFQKHARLCQEGRKILFGDSELLCWELLPLCDFQSFQDPDTEETYRKIYMTTSYQTLSGVQSLKTAYTNVFF